MSSVFSLLQSLCIFLIASSAYGGELPENIKSQYTNCYEFSFVFRDDVSTSSSEDSDEIDNLCIDSDKFTYHFLSSAQGGTTSLITAQISEMTVIFFLRYALGISLQFPSEPVLNLHCHFKDPTHAVDVYKSIYKSRSLPRENFKISRIHQFEFDSVTSDTISDRILLSQQAALFTEFYDNTKMILNFRKESANDDVGDPALVLLAYTFNISEVIASNVVLRNKRYKQGSSLIYCVLTFCNESEANDFCNSLRGYFNRNKVELNSIPAELREALGTMHS